MTLAGGSSPADSRHICEAVAVLDNADCAYGFPLHIYSNLDAQNSPGAKHGSAAPQSPANKEAAVRAL